MAYPDLYNDESVLLNAQNVKVKSVTFEAVLTNRRLILVDSKKHLIAPQEILLATLKNIESGENAIRDPTITLSLVTNSGATRQMILTFSKASGGDRKRECDEWIRLLRQFISPGYQPPVQPIQDISTPVAEPVHLPDTPPVSRMEIASTPQPKKKIEIARPIMKIVENPPAIPKPIETTSLPTGSFCNRCGNRVPPESAFCNRCGTPVVRDPDQIPPETPAPPVAEVPPVPAPAVPVQETPQPQAPAQPIPQLHVPIPAPVFGSAAGETRKERPIEQVIHSIEPLIEDSVPRTAEAPLIPKPVSAYTAPAPVAEEPAPAASADTQPAAPADAAAATAAPDAGGVQWPVIGAGSPAAPAADQAAQVPPPVPPAPRKTGSKKIVLAAVAIIAIIAIIACAAIFLKPAETPAPAVTPATTPTTVPPTPTAAATTAPVATVPVMSGATPAPSDTAASSSQFVIPATGVWIRINYPGLYTATFGTPGSESTRNDSGEHIYQVYTSTGIVVASVQKVDASGRELNVQIYKDGSMVTEKSTTSPKGIVEIQADLKPSPTPTTIAPVTTTTAAATTTASPATAANVTSTTTTQASS